jgi:hypothetical protein
VIQTTSATIAASATNRRKNHVSIQRSRNPPDFHAVPRFVIERR